MIRQLSLIVLTLGVVVLVMLSAMVLAAEMQGTGSTVAD